MPFDSMDDPVQSDTGNLAGMSELLGEAKANPYVAGSTADGSQSSLRKPKRQELSIIWRTGNQVLLSIGHQGGNLDFGECARCMPGERNGSNRQQWALRTGEYQICSKEESGQSRIDGAVGMGSAVLAVQQGYTLTALTSDNRLRVQYYSERAHLFWEDIVENIFL